MTTVSCYFAERAHDADEVIDGEILAEGRLQRLGPEMFGECEAVLYYLKPVSRTPGWIPALQAGFDDLPDLRFGTAGAALVVKVPDEAPGELFLAFTFGTGRFLLDADVWARGFGARAALNVIFEGDDGTLPASRLQSINATRFEATRLQISHQTSRSSPFEAFGIDVIRDVLREVVGTPVDEERWGTRIGGADPLKLSSFPSFGKLCDLSSRILDMGRRSDYTRRFDWIDHVREVRDPGVKERLVERVTSDLSEGQLEPYDLVVPTVVEWDRIDRFQFDADRAPRNQEPQRRVDPTVRPFLKSLREGTTITRDLLGRKKLYAIDGDGEQQYQWSIWSCLSAELEDSGRAYVLDNGAFYEIDPDYDKLIRKFVDAIEEWTQGLPPGVIGEGEDQYNIGAAMDSDTLLLMDERLVRLDSRTTPVEVCDLYAADGTLVHVKKHRGASSMSHLLSQGAVSADLLVMSRGFREEALDHLRTAANQKAKGKKGGDVLKTFHLFDAQGITPGEHRVVFAILDRRWDGKSLSDGLSFFSRVNLRRTVEDVRRLGYQVAACRVALKLS